MMKKQLGYPVKQGLYDPDFEHDACGMGFVAHLKGQISNRIVKQAIEILENLKHRGATGAEENTGDGAGILFRMPHSFYQQAFQKINLSLPEEGKYGLAMMFLPRSEKERMVCMDAFIRITEEENCKVLGFRDLPVDNIMIGNSAKACEPVMKQAVVISNHDFQDILDFERKLYVIRKRCENLIRKSSLEEKNLFYFSSFSARTVVYKGMLTPQQVKLYFKDLQDPALETSIALVHSRFSTNTFPSWDRAHPNRYIIHNGEINTLRGNVNWMFARQSLIQSDHFGSDIEKVFPIINPNGSDSGMFDNVFEFLSLTGRSMPHALMMMIPEPWKNDETIDEEKRAFYAYHSCLMEPWDGPAAMAFTDGIVVGASLDRNGLRPSRYYVTRDDLIVLSSEVGVMSVEPQDVLIKERLHPGKMLLVDTKKGKIILDEELKHQLATEKPYQKWLEQHMVLLENIPQSNHTKSKPETNLMQKQAAFGYTWEDVRKMILPMAETAHDPIGAMGTDSPVAVLSNESKLLYDYFKQLFAQVTNPPIDAQREEIITSCFTTIGSEGNLIHPTPESCRHIGLETPIIDNASLEKLRNIKMNGYQAVTLPMLFPVQSEGAGLEKALEDVFNAADNAIDNGVNLIILSDRGMNEELCPIPALLAVSGLHHHLIRNGKRTRVGIIIESGEPRVVHHFALLLGYGAQAINPYLALESIHQLIETGLLNKEYLSCEENYITAVTEGVIKILSKMGISTIQSYRGAQIFECLGIKEEVIEKYFTRTPSRIEGIGLFEIAMEAKDRHGKGFLNDCAKNAALDSGSEHQWRSNGDNHLYHPQSIYYLQRAVREGSYALFKEYTKGIDDTSEKIMTIRGLLEFKPVNPSIPIDEVESVREILKRFKTGAMSYGSIGKEAHETIAIAMNRLGGKSNSGEGGEDPARYVPDENGDLRSSAIKQVASGRFGVTSHYLTNANEIQIKMAQGAKPGEGGHLPGEKVYPWIAQCRGTTPGVDLISPPPHHDIYSIEDLAQLIHDLKNANRDARISVKLVSEVGVGTIAAGVAKGKADVILISGYDGGTGAAPKTSIRHAGLPWELGLSETHQTLVLNNLRSRVVLETDGKLMTGRDVAIAALLGAEEFGFATSVLVALGCVMMRVCNLDTCPVGVATQNPRLRKLFCGKPEHVVNFMTFIAQEIREYMAMLGFRSLQDMIGRVDVLKQKPSFHWKAKGVDLSRLLYAPQAAEYVGRHCTTKQNHGLEQSMDLTDLLSKCQNAIDHLEKTFITMPIQNTNRVVGTIIGHEITKNHGEHGLPPDTITLSFYGSAGQSFAAFAPKGLTFMLEGDANDYFGKGLSGAKVSVFPPKGSTFAPHENIIIGNVAFYGATAGEAYIHGVAGERFCVRNSGVHAVVEGVGDHGCEYMTGGRVVVLGRTGRNFAAGMSGGVAYVYSPDRRFISLCNTEFVELSTLSEDHDIWEVREMIRQHVENTGSLYAKKLLDQFDPECFVRVMPTKYNRIMKAINQYKEQGMSDYDARLAAFEENK